MKTLASNVLYIRKQNKLSQAALAAAISVNPRSISKWELEHQNPTIDELLKLSEAFNISLDRLVKTNLNKSEKSKLYTDKIFLNNLKYLLHKRPMSAKGLAQALGITVGEVNDWLSNKTEPPSHLVTRIARIFSISVDALTRYQLSK